MQHKIIITILLLFAGISAYTQKTPFVLSSKIENLEGKEVYVTVWDGSTGSRNITLPLVNGQFSFSEEISSALVIRVSATNADLLKKPDPNQGGAYPTKAASMWCVVLPGEKVKLVGRLTDYAEVLAEGGRENPACNKIIAAYFPVLNKEMNLKVKLARMSATDEGRIALQKELEEASLAALKIFKKDVLANMSSIIGLHFTNDLMLRNQLSIKEASAAIKTLQPQYKTTGFYNLVAGRLSAGKYAVGAKMMAISGDMPNDQPFVNASLKGKYYLIDFWGSWCHPCMEGMPQLLALKEKYAGKLSILGIDVGDTKEKWKKTIADKGLDWYHIMNGRGDNDFVSKLNITGYPTLILVDPSGTILYRSTGEKAELNQAIDRFLSKK